MKTLSQLLFALFVSMGLLFSAGAASAADCEKTSQVVSGDFAHDLPELEDH